MIEELRRSEVVYQGRLLSVRLEWWADRQGREHLREIVGHPGSVVVLAVAGGDEVLMVKQFRQAIRRTSWEICAGTMSGAEDPLLGAQRELREETGYSAQRWSRGPSLHPSPGVLNEVMHLFLAEELSLGEAQPEEDEDLEVSSFSPQEIDRMAARGEVCDMKTLLAVALWRQGWPEEGAGGGGGETPR